MTHRKYTTRMGTEVKTYHGFGVNLVPLCPVLALMVYLDKQRCCQVWGLDNYTSAVTEFERFMEDLRLRNIECNAIYYVLGGSEQ